MTYLIKYVLNERSFKRKVVQVSIFIVLFKLKIKADFVRNALNDLEYCYN